MGIRSKMKDFRFWLSAWRNTGGYDFYYNKIKELSVSCYEWENLPDTVDPRFLELTLFERGSAIFFKDDVIGFLCLPSANWGKWNVYNIPMVRRAFASNGYQNELTIENSVIIWNNSIRTPSVADCKMFAERLSEYDRTIDVNVNAQRTPVLIRCDEKERLSFVNMYKDYEGNMPVIFADKSLSVNPFEVIKTDAPYVADKIYELKVKYWNEMLTFKGITNVNVEKRERLITDEVNRSQGGTMASRYSGLMMRQQACDEINRMFGLNVSCRFRDGLDGGMPDPADEESEVQPYE